MAKPILVLIVDDRTLFTGLLADLLQKLAGLPEREINSAATLHEASEIINGDQFLDLMIINSQVADQSSYDLIQLFRGKFPDSHIIGVSDDKEGVQSLNDAGVDSAYCKPVPLSAFFNALMQVHPK